MLSKKEVAKILGVSEWTVGNLLKEGRLVGHKIGASWRIEKKEVDIYLESVKNTKDSEAVSDG